VRVRGQGESASALTRDSLGRELLMQMGHKDREGRRAELRPLLSEEEQQAQEAAQATPTQWRFVCWFENVDGRETCSRTMRGLCTPVDLRRQWLVSSGALCCDADDDTDAW
jgi:hypothetical protein